MTRSGPDWGALQEAIAGDVVFPDSSAYRPTRKPAIARYHDVRPQAVVLCATPADVSETISFASRSGPADGGRERGTLLRWAVRGIVIDVTAMRSVSVSSGVATVGAGVRLGDVYDSLAEHGRGNGVHLRHRRYRKCPPASQSSRRWEGCLGGRWR